MLFSHSYVCSLFNPKILKATVYNLIESRKMLQERFKGIQSIIPDDIVTNKVDHKFLSKLLAIIEKNLPSADMDVNTLCLEAGMSRSVLYRKIKAITGHSIQDFIRTIRLKKASQLLAEKDVSINEVAYLVGFTNPKHFSTSFRKTFGRSPSDFRSSLA